MFSRLAIFTARKCQNLQKTFTSLSSILPAFYLPSFDILQNQIEPAMDEVANDSSNFICHRAEEADTQAGRLISQALLHQANTGDSSRSTTSLNVLSWKFVCLPRRKQTFKKPFLSTLCLGNCRGYRLWGTRPGQSRATSKALRKATSLGRQSRRELLFLLVNGAHIVCLI